MKRLRKAGLWVFITGLSLPLAGCGNKFFDPTQIGRFRPTPAVNVILDSLGVAEEAPVAWEGGEDPRPSDIVAVKGDYVLRSGDLVRVWIFELLQDGVPLINDYLVSETGKVSIPEVGVVQAAGLTETQLEEEIKEILSPSILREPSITVTLLNSQQRTFSILGNGVPQPGRYVIPRYDFRLTDALATARGPMQFNVSYIYVSRKPEEPATPLDIETGKPTMPELELMEPESSRGRLEPRPSPPTPDNASVSGSPREIPEPTEPAEPFELERDMLDLITPSARTGWPASRKVVPTRTESERNDDVSATVMPSGFRLLVPQQTPRRQRPQPQDVVLSPTVLADDDDDRVEPPRGGSEEAGRVEWVFRDGQWVPILVKSGEEPRQAPAETGTGGEIEWVLRDGRWVPIPKGEPRPTRPPTGPEPGGPTLPLEDEKLPMELEWEEAIQVRLIRIPADRLLAGDPQYNIVIKPGDTIYVPVDIIGEFCITGNVNRGGFINITGRPMTLKMAIAAAGGLGPLAWPKHCEVVRRIGKKEEVIVMVDLDKIARGEQPDFFIKPNDLISVGTHPTSRWRAVLRNAFRAAYGFGFVYDRNFADGDYGKGWPSWL